MFMVIEHIFFKEYFIDKYLKYLSNIYTLRNILSLIEKYLKYLSKYFTF